MDIAHALELLHLWDAPIVPWHWANCRNVTVYSFEAMQYNDARSTAAKVLCWMDILELSWIEMKLFIPVGKRFLGFDYSDFSEEGLLTI